MRCDTSGRWAHCFLSMDGTDEGAIGRRLAAMGISETADDDAPERARHEAKAVGEERRKEGGDPALRGKELFCDDGRDEPLPTTAAVTALPRSLLADHSSDLFQHGKTANPSITLRIRRNEPSPRDHLAISPAKALSRFLQELYGPPRRHLTLQPEPARFWARRVAGNGGKGRHRLP
jgi:hypothetical protein